MTKPCALEGSRRGPAREQPSRTSSSDSDRSKVAKTSKSPRGAAAATTATATNQSQKKLSTRIADLESQLGHAHDELKCLKNQLASTDTAKKAAEKKKKPNKHNKVPQSPSPSPSDVVETETDVRPETEVFEVSIEKVTVDEHQEPKASEKFIQHLQGKEDGFESPKAIDNAVNELEKEIELLQANLKEKEIETELIRRENESLKSQLNEKSSKISSTESEMEELNSRLSKILKELEQSKSVESEMRGRMERADRAREEMEAEMAKLRVQTEQWRKAADAAAAVLAGGVEMNGRRISERCGSMDTNVFDRVSGGCVVGSPGLNDDGDYGFGSEKRRTGIRMLGELWKKKGQK
ncbi:interactor of constitutive active ROPs 4-like [Andrographis paniculata]|uniref:interactor of constitutive active ROPs 4-like n=1 Tax=Andrographis paniculata TaxID=175694 RepID=UPI0021E778B8|nr:interactor of constitutive active ROPs 4-like [Andrographis paniculata]